MDRSALPAQLYVNDHAPPKTEEEEEDQLCLFKEPAASREVETLDNTAAGAASGPSPTAGEEEEKKGPIDADVRPLSTRTGAGAQRPPRGWCHLPTTSLP